AELEIGARQLVRHRRMAGADDGLRLLVLDGRRLQPVARPQHAAEARELARALLADARGVVLARLRRLARALLEAQLALRRQKPGVHAQLLAAQPIAPG